MCRFDEARHPVIEEWLEDFGFPKDIAKMVTGYEGCLESKTHEWKATERRPTHRFESVCKCTAEKRDREFVLHSNVKTPVHGEVWRFDKDLKPVASKYGQEEKEERIFDGHPLVLRESTFRDPDNSMMIGFSVCMGYRKGTLSRFFNGKKEDQDAIREIIDRTRETTGSPMPSPDDLFRDVTESVQAWIQLGRGGTIGI